MYLNWTKLDHPENQGYPLFYTPQIERFYFRQLCFEDPYSLGYLIIGARGFGKTSEESACMVESMTRPPHNRKAALQSKSEADAQQYIFMEKMVPIFNAYPDFFQPTYSHGTDAKNRMLFRQESKTGKDKHKQLKGNEWELGNMMYPRPAKEKAIDGGTFAEVLNDEVGKTDPKKEADVYVRTRTNIRCVYRNSAKIGLLRETSTVEEMEEGGSECLKIWAESDPKDRTPNGYTKSRLYKFFVSATETQADLADEYGFIPEKQAEQKVLNNRAGIEDADDLSLEIRKDPLNEDEAFLIPQNRCLFNVFILTERKKQLREIQASTGRLPGRPGFLEWKHGVQDGDVEFIDNPTGPFRLYRYPGMNDGIKSVDQTDRSIYNSLDFFVNEEGKKLWLPTTDDLFGGGLDPIKWVKTDDPRASKFAAYGFEKYNVNIDQDKPVSEWITHNLMWRYFQRSEDPLDDYENMLKAMKYFGHSMMPESNLTDFTQYAYQRGYMHCIVKRNDFDPDVLSLKNSVKKIKVAADAGVSSVPEIINQYVRKIKTFVKRHGMRIPDLELIDQLLEFDSKKPTKHDLVVALGYTLFSIEKRIQESMMDDFEINSLVQRYDVNGMRSRPLTEEELENEVQH